MQDRNTDPLLVDVPKGHLARGQLPHLLLLSVLLPGAWCLGADALGDDSWLGLTDRNWFHLALAVPVVHQVVVALLWRAQLSSSLLTKLFGDQGFYVWAAIFLPLLVGRPLTLLGLAITDAGSLGVPELAGWLTGAVLVLPALWTMHSIKSHFGITRALGADHFFERYRAMPMVREGAFAWSSNAMYTFAFLGLWAIALIAGSQAALAVAVFQHAYIWVHWYCTEQPDGVVLYGWSPDSATS